MSDEIGASNCRINLFHCIKAKCPNLKQILHFTLENFPSPPLPDLPPLPRLELKSGLKLHKSESAVTLTEA